MDWTGLDELIEILEEYRKESRFATITVQIRDHEYVHVKKIVDGIESDRETQE